MTPPLPMHHRTGTILNDAYLLEEQLAIGGNSLIYNARHLSSHQRVAIKLIDPSSFRNPEMARARFAREAQSSTTLHHPNILKTLDFGQDAQGMPYLVMELLEGEDLSARMAGPISELQLAQWMLQVLKGLGAAHHQGFVHRDIKPSNIFISHQTGDSDQVKILDFGLVKHIDQPNWHRATELGALLGTPAYMSPEQVNDHTVTAPADLWGVGAVMFHVMTGRPPVKGTSTIDMLRNLAKGHIDNIYDENRPYPPELLDVVYRALRYDPSERWPSARAMAAPLTSFVRLYQEHDPIDQHSTDWDITEIDPQSW